MRQLTIIAIWGLATAAALYVAVYLPVGSVLFVVKGYHGIHAGDLAAFVVAWAWAAVATVALLPDRRR